MYFPDGGCVRILRTLYVYATVTPPNTATHLNTNPALGPAVHGRKSNSRPADHKSDALTTTPPSL